MVGLARLVIAEPADVGFHTALLLDLYGHDFDLVVSEADLDLEHVGHHKLIGFNRVKVVLLLAAVPVRHLPSSWDVHLVLLPVTTHAW